MNVIIKRVDNHDLNKLKIEVIKTLIGEFTIEEVSQNLSNIFYNKVIIDIASIKNYNNIDTVLKFLRGFDPTQIILLLDTKVGKNSEFLDKIIESGVYNIAHKVEEIPQLLISPNTYETVTKLAKTKINLFSKIKKLFKKS